MSKKHPYYFIVLARFLYLNKSISCIFIRGFIDMLRYDQAKVHDIVGGMIVLESIRIPTEQRWASFGIPIWSITQDPKRTIEKTREDAGSLIEIP